MKDQAILITGCARSGTSLVAGIIAKCGAFGGKVTGSTPLNKKGQFENEYIRDNITKPYLSSIGADPLGQDPLPTAESLKPYPELRRHVEHQLTEEGYKRGRWYYKGAKLCLYWQLWHEAFPLAKWIIVRRDPRDIAQSCLHTNFMRAYRNEEGWLQWVDAHLDRFTEMHQNDLDIREVWPEGIVQGYLADIQDIVKWAGLEWAKRECSEFITPELYHIKWQGSSKETSTRPPPSG